jgi:microcystin-dependent protein
MAQPYVGEIRMFAGNFAPAGWMFCAGQLLPISENETLFTLIGTTYGGDGQETFQLPDLRGRVPIHAGTNAGVTFQLGESAGVESVTLTVQQVPAHTHQLVAVNAAGSQVSPAGTLPAQSFNVTPYINDVPTGNFNAGAVGPAGGSQPHDNLMPYLCIDFIISLFGLFPNP